MPEINRSSVTIFPNEEALEKERAFEEAVFDVVDFGEPSLPGSLAGPAFDEGGVSSFTVERRAVEQPAFDGPAFRRSDFTRPALDEPVPGGFNNAVVGGGASGGPGSGTIASGGGGSGGGLAFFPLRRAALNLEKS
jgi:hypothetical protein